MREYSSNNIMKDEVDNNIVLKKMLSVLMDKWKWFLLSILFCLACASFYLWYSTKVYTISATALIRETDSKINPAPQGVNLSNIGFLAPANSVSDEIEIMRSKTVMKKAILATGSFVTYTTKDGFLSHKDLYTESPVIVTMGEENLNKLSSDFALEIRILDVNKIEVNGSIGEKKITTGVVACPYVLNSPVGPIQIALKPDVPSVKSGKVSVVVHALDQLVNDYLDALSILKKENTNSIVNIEFKSTHRRRGEDFVNEFIRMYNRTADMDKNLIAQKTDDFINERIKIIAYGLGDAETALERTKKAAGLTNLSDFQNVVSGNASAEKERVQINTQLQLVKYLREYVYNPQNKDQVIPANIGIENTTLTTLISNYNEQLLKRNRYLESSTPENPMVVRKTEELRTLKQNILTSINNVYQSLLINKRDIDTHASKLAGRILNAPTQERELTDISRQQEIKSSLYLMLLQKREENNIKLASTADNARIIDPAIASRKPVNPNPFTVRLIALILGILIPVIILLLLNFFKTKISSVEDIRKLTTIPIFAQVPWIKDLKKLQIVIKEKDNTPLSEVFRKIRTNLRLALKRENNKVVLVTSTVKDEGKTFIASNLAASLSLLGKKVLIIGMDMRNPQLINVFGLKEQSIGLSDMLLAGNRNYDSYIQTSTYYDNLFILPAGKNSVNSTELLELPLLQEIVKELKMKFDFVIIDTVSVGEDVVDAFVISDLADATLYVCRGNHVKRDQFSTVNELITQGILRNVSIVFNG